MHNPISCIPDLGALEPPALYLSAVKSVRISAARKSGRCDECKGNRYRHKVRHLDQQPSRRLGSAPL
jgi:hypothetical protein